MQSFRQFASNALNQVLNWFKGWWNGFRNAVLGSAKSDGQSVSFRFPNILGESAHFQGGKGLRILQNIDTSAWKPKQKKSFSSMLSRGIQNISSPLGSQFEIDTVISLAEKFKVQIEGTTTQNLQQLRGEYAAKIQQHLGDPFVYEQFDNYTRNHASELAGSIYAKTLDMLKCKPNRLQYMPQSSQDLRLYCAEGKADWSLKYVTEPFVSVRTLGIQEAYQLLQGSDSSRDVEYYTFLAQTSEPEEFRKLVLDDIQSAVEESGLLDDPNQFAQLLTYLIRGNEKALLAIKNYVTNVSAVAEPSVFLQRDFEVKTTKHGLLLYPKPGAAITLSRSVHAVRLNYKAPGGTGTGTSILMLLNERSGDTARIQFKINNLTYIKRGPRPAQ